MNPDIYTPESRTSNGAWGTIAWIVLTVVVGLGIFGGILLATQRKEYSQATPEDVLASAIQMVRDGNTDRLTDLIYADNQGYRSTLIRVGKLFETMQGLGQAMARAFPTEVEQARARLRSELEGKSDGVLTAMMTASANGPVRIDVPRNPQDRVQREQQFQDIITRLFADPFGMLDAGADRLSVERIADDTAVIKFDKQPVLGGVFTIRKHGDRWWFVLPLNLPGVNQYTPQTQNEWSIVASLVKVFDNALGELRDDINAGKAGSVKRVGELAGEKAFIPVGMVVVMYAKEMDVRSRRERGMTSFRKRWGEWVRSRDEPVVVQRQLTELASKAAIEGLDAIVRRRTADRESVQMPRFEGMSDADLVALVEAWLRDAGGPLDLRQPIDDPSVKDALAKVDVKSKSGIRSRPAPVK